MERLDAISKLNDNGPVAKNEELAAEAVRFAVGNQDELARRLGAGALPDQRPARRGGKRSERTTPREIHIASILGLSHHVVAVACWWCYSRRV